MSSSTSFTSAISVCLANPEPFLAVYPWMEMLCREQTPGFGKTIFPKMDFNIAGLNPDKLYEVSFSFERLGKEKYTYDKEWKVKGKPEEEHEYNRISKGMETGSTWMEKPFSVPEARITNVPENKKVNTFYLTPLHKYVPVVFIWNVETGQELRFEVELAQFLPTTKRYNKTLSSSNARTNPNSTVRNNGPGKPVKKRKTEEDGNGAPKAKKTPLQEKQVQLSNFSTSSPSTSTTHSAHPNQHFPPQLHQHAMGHNYFPPSTSAQPNNFGSHRPTSTFHSAPPHQYFVPQFHCQPGFSHNYPAPFANNFGYQWQPAPFHSSTGYSNPAFFGYTTPSPIPYYPTPAGTPDTFFPPVQNENIPRFPTPPTHFNTFS